MTTKKPRPPALRVMLGDEIIADNFAGGGGASTGIALALGRDPDIAINHDAEAIAMHAANHPGTRHYTTNIWDVDPVLACGGKPVALAWFSPDCKHHSKAKGGKPRAAKIRGLAWTAVRWAAAVRPRVIALENVEEFVDWGPLVDGKPCPRRKGHTFRAFVRKLERLGYVVAWRMLRACDFGAPTTRKRLYLMARCDGIAPAWPEPTHGPGRAHPHRAAAEIIDWSIPCPSIFERPRPLADKTNERIARGVRKFVLESAAPFVMPYYGDRRPAEASRGKPVQLPLPTITTANRFGLVTPYVVPVNHGGVGRTDHRVHAPGDPMPTITSHGRGAHAVVTPLLVSMRGTESSHVDASSRPVSEPVRTISAGGTHHAVAVPYLVHRSNGERPGQAPRIYDPKKPIGTIVAQGQKHAVCTAFLARHFGDRPTGGWAGGASVEKPLPTVTTRDHNALVTVSLSPAEEARAQQVAAFLVRYNGQSKEFGLEEPIGTLDTHDRYALVTVTIAGEEYVIVDIGMRMLTPGELFAAQGFPPDYQIAPMGPKGKRLNRTAQVRMCGNSVCPPMSEALIRAQQIGAAA